MRLIDADALENDIRRVLKKSYMFSTRTFLALHMMIDIIRGRDTIRAEPVRHGKWIATRKTLYSVQCSECRGYAISITPYCPNCGAKMNVGCSGQDCRNIERK